MHFILVGDGVLVIGAPSKMCKMANKSWNSKGDLILKAGPKDVFLRSI